MSEGIPYADIVILALVAGFILLRLRNVLGTKNDMDHMNYFNKTQSSLRDQQEPIVQLDEKSLKQPKPREEPDTYLAQLANPALAESLEAIKAKDPSFSATHFMQGAGAAYEMVFDAFNKGDKQTLKMLLSDALYQEFSKEIDNREIAGQKTETTLVSAKAKDITQAALNRNTARLSVRFDSEQVHIVRNAKGEIIEGDPSHVHLMDDEWVFERDITSKNPNWKIIET